MTAWHSGSALVRTFSLRVVDKNQLYYVVLASVNIR
jgi:hypothetical protein